MHQSGTGSRAPGRDPRGRVWSALSLPNLGRKGIPPRLLLAHRAGGRSRSRAAVPGMPIPRQADAPTSPGPSDYPALVAVRGLGAGHSGPVQAGAWRLQVLYVAIDKFTKWPEAYPVGVIDKHSAVRFMRGITARFGIPNRLITDNGTQFTNELFGKYCKDMGIKRLATEDGTPLPNPWNISHLRKFYP